VRRKHSYILQKVTSGKVSVHTHRNSEVNAHITEVGTLRIIRFWFKRLAVSKPFDSGITDNSNIIWFLSMNQKKTPNTQKNKNVTVLCNYTVMLPPAHVTPLCTSDTNLSCLIAVTEYEPSQTRFLLLHCLSVTVEASGDIGLTGYLFLTCPSWLLRLPAVYVAVLLLL